MIEIFHWKTVFWNYWWIISAKKLVRHLFGALLYSKLWKIQELSGFFRFFPAGCRKTRKFLKPGLARNLSCRSGSDPEITGRKPAESLRKFSTGIRTRNKPDRSTPLCLTGMVWQNLTPKEASNGLSGPNLWVLFLLSRQTKRCVYLFPESARSKVI